MSFLGGLFGGDSSSSSTASDSTQQTTTGGNQSSNLTIKSGSNNTTNVQMLDAGAVQASLNLAENMFSGALQHTQLTDQAAIDAVNHAGSQLAAAYQNGNAGDQTQLKYAGFILVGIVAAIALIKGL